MEEQRLSEISQEGPRICCDFSVLGESCLLLILFLSMLLPVIPCPHYSICITLQQLLSLFSWCLANSQMEGVVFFPSYDAFNHNGSWNLLQVLCNWMTFVCKGCIHCLTTNAT